jgi:uncharacterized metal-binding protein
MSKAVVEIGYRKLVLPLAKAVQVVDLLGDAEIYETAYHKDEVNDKSVKTHHIFGVDIDNSIQMHIISDVEYSKYKLAGKPKKS